MDKTQLKKIKSVFSKYPSVKLAYFFGSKKRKDDSPMSDYDFAVYLNKKDNKKILETRLSLFADLTKILKTDKIDILAIDQIKQPELKFSIIKEGELIFEREPYKVVIEPKIMNEYFDFRMTLFKNGLIKEL